MRVQRWQQQRALLLCRLVDQLRLCCSAAARTLYMSPVSFKRVQQWQRQRALLFRASPTNKYLPIQNA